MTDDKRFPELRVKDELYNQQSSNNGVAVAACARGTTATELGTRLRTARRARGLSLADCAARLHLPLGVLDRLETGNFGEPEHFVFLRGALQGYARFLDLPEGCCDDALRAAAPPIQPALVSVARTSSAHRLARRYGTAATYIVLTGMIVVPLVWLGLHGGLERPAARTVSLQQAPIAAQRASHPEGATDAAATTKQPPATPEVTPFRASMAPFAAIGLRSAGAATAASAATSTAPPPVPEAIAATYVPDRHTLTLAANADCWFEITGAEGNKLGSGMLHAGDVRTWHPKGLLHITLGNVSAATVTDDGKPVNLGAFQRGNVAHLKLFAPAAGASENH